MHVMVNESLYRFETHSRLSVQVTKFLPPLLVVCLTIGYRLAVGWHPFDDAFITFRYARNLSEGLGLVYNAGERVLGTTAPPYAVAVAVLHRFMGTDFESLAWAINLVAEALNVLLLYAVCDCFGLAVPTRVGVGAIYATAVYTAGVANGGMETPLFVSAILASALAISAERWRLAGVALGLAILLRPEGLVAATAALALLGLKQRRAVLPVVGCVAAMCLPWLLILTWFYGSPIPQSMTAKMAMQQPPLTALVGLWNAMAVAFWPQAKDSLPLLAATTIIGLYVVVLGLIGARKQTWKAWYVPLVLGGLTVFYLGSNPAFFEWYAMPFVPLTFIIGAVGLEKALGRRLAASLLVALAAWQGAVWLASGTPMFPYQDQRIALYREAARWLNTQGSGSSYIAASEIGVIGYTIPAARILDTVGLVSPEAVKFRAGRRAISEIGYDDGSTDLVLAMRPDYIVSLDSLGPSAMEASPIFRKEYRKVYEKPTEVFDSTSLQIWERVTN
jgi:hypothetical protein